jgi:drug/metabolite transporter (DMT)-like permease
VLAAFAAIAAAWGYGTANFLGGLASRRQHAALTLLLSQATAFPIVLTAALLSAGTPGDTALGAAAGTLGFCGAACAYLCFSLGRPVGIAAVLLATTAAAVPVAVGLLSGTRPGPVAVAGLAVAACAVIVLGWPEQTTTDTRVAMLALAGGAMFGSYHTVMSQTSSGTGMWPLVTSQGVIVALALAAALALRHGHRLGRRDGHATTMSVADGAASTVATIAALAAVRIGSLPSVGMLIALAPAVTTLLAWIFIHERLQGRRAAGLALALTAIACLTTP